MTFELYDALLVLLALAVTLAAFVSERAAPEIVAFAGVAGLIIVGIVGVDDLLASFANNAPFTVACMFVLSAALENTGLIDELGRRVTALPRLTPLLAMILLMSASAALSAFVNNTPIVVILTPVAISLATSLGEPASRFLMPLSFAAVMGGTITLIGTSTNIVVDGVARKAGLAPFGLFEIAWLGIPMTLAGIAYMALVGWRLLPRRESMAEQLPDMSRRRFLAEFLVPAGSPLIGRTVEEAGLTRELEASLVDLLRDDRAFSEDAGRVPLEAGDRLVLRSHANDLMALHAQGHVHWGPAETHAVEPITSQQVMLMEGIVGPNSRWIDRRVSSLNIRRRFNVRILAIHRQNENLGRKFEEVRLQVGDTLLLEGPAEGYRQLFNDQFLIGLNAPTFQPFRRNRRWLALAAIVAVVVVASLELMPIAGIAFIATIAVILGGCLDAEQAYRSIRWPILMLIFAMITLGAAMEKSGAARLIVDLAASAVGGLGPTAVLAMLYGITVILTELMSNNAVGILMTPIAVGLAHSLGIDPRPMVIAVMFAASNGYATPIGYQTNTFIFAAGNYRFTDFIKVGLPLDIILGIVAVLLIPMIWPLVP